MGARLYASFALWRAGASDRRYEPVIAGLVDLVGPSDQITDQRPSVPRGEQIEELVDTRNLLLAPDRSRHAFDPFCPVTRNKRGCLVIDQRVDALLQQARRLEILNRECHACR